MTIPFSKYQGAGNDFVLIDNRSLKFPKENRQLIHQLCDRRFGIGADGLMLLENETSFDFRMIYYNADGNESSMCGNGGRCIAAFAKEIGVIENQASFIAIDGPHYAHIKENGNVALGMLDINTIEKISEMDYFLNTGSPHFVRVLDVMPENFVNQAKEIRYNNRFQEEGVNVNFIIVKDNHIAIRTYERGVEDETLACGTGAVAAAAVANQLNNLLNFKIGAKGGSLEVSFDLNYKNIVLAGPATAVFQGRWAWN